MAAKSQFVRIQDKGQITLPAEVRRRFGLKQGDVVVVRETPEGILITPREVIATEALAEIGAALQKQELSLEDLIERGKVIRWCLLREQYGLTDTSNS